MGEFVEVCVEVEELDNGICKKEENKVEAWLPITGSREGGVWSSTFHLLCSGIGVNQVLALPIAFVALGWFWGILCLLLGFCWQLYTIWLLVHLHESDSGIRYSRYLHLAKAAFGEKMGKLLALFPVMYLSGGTCVILVITGGGTLELFYQTMSGNEPRPNTNLLSGSIWFLLFVFSAILVAQFFPNLDSIVGISFIGSISGVGYCTLVWALSAYLEKSNDFISVPADVASSKVNGVRAVLGALGIIALAFRGHNLVLEIQGTVPSTPKQQSHRPMWNGVKFSYLLISMCIFPLAIGGYLAYGNMVVSDKSVLVTLSKFHGRNIPKYALGIIYILVLTSCLCSFQIFAMPVFANLEFLYVTKKDSPCPRCVRVGFRLFFGALTFFIASAFPFLPSLAALLGGITLPLTYAYPCFMWIAIKKSTISSAKWWSNLCLGCLGMVLGVVVVLSAVWDIVCDGFRANFFNPH